MFKSYKGDWFKWVGPEIICVFNKLLENADTVVRYLLILYIFVDISNWMVL